MADRLRVTDRLLIEDFKERVRQMTDGELRAHRTAVVHDPRFVRAIDELLAERRRDRER